MVTARDVAALREQLLNLAREAQAGQAAVYFSLLRADEGLARTQALLELNEDPRKRELYQSVLGNIRREQEERGQEGR